MHATKRGSTFSDNHGISGRLGAFSTEELLPNVVRLYGGVRLDPTGRATVHHRVARSFFHRSQLFG